MKEVLVLWWLATLSVSLCDIDNKSELRQPAIKGIGEEETVFDWASER